MWFLLSMAWAVDAKVCVETVTNFLDADVGSTQDYFASNGTRRLRGTKIELRDSVTLAVQSAYADSAGADKGCAEFSVVAFRPYAIRVVADVSIGGGELTVRGPGGGVWHRLVDSSKSFPLVAPTATYTLPTSDIWNIVAVGGFALHRDNLGGAAFTKFYTEDSSGNLNSPCGGPCIQGDSAWLTPFKARQQFAITYAMGWSHLEGMGGVNYDDTMAELDYNGATGLHLLSPEYPSAAHAEGFAHLYSAVVFNDIESDCGFTYWKDANWDLLGTTDGTGSCFREIETAAYHRFSCATGRKHVAPAYHQAAYYEHMDPYIGTTTLNSTFETSIDVLRFWWDAMASYGLTYDDVVAVVKASDPSTWPSTGAITYGTDLTDTSGPAGANALSTAEYDELTARHGVD